MSLSMIDGRRLHPAAWGRVRGVAGTCGDRVGRPHWCTELTYTKQVVALVHTHFYPALIARHRPPHHRHNKMQLRFACARAHRGRSAWLQALLAWLCLTTASHGHRGARRIVHGTPTSRKSVLYSRSTGGIGLRDASCLIQTPHAVASRCSSSSRQHSISSYRRIVVSSYRRRTGA
eukprot:COSAG02_NODE_1424_length_12684_cov_13.471116_12_plen_176_part_00